MRLLVSDVNERLAEVIADVSDIVQNYLVESGYEPDEAEKMYDIYIEKMNNREKKKMVLSTDLTSYEFDDIRSQLNSAVDQMSPGSYFYKKSNGVFECVIDVSKKEETSIISEKDIELAAERLAGMVSDFVSDPEMEVTDTSLSIDDGIVSVYVQLMGNRFDTVGNFTVDEADVISKQQFKNDMIETLYPELVNNLHNVI